MRGLQNRWTLHLPRAAGPLLRCPISLYSVFPSLTAKPVLVFPVRGQPLLPASEPARLGMGGIHADQNWLVLVQELEVN